jgi:hypothetical protein
MQSKRAQCVRLEIANAPTSSLDQRNHLTSEPRLYGDALRSKPPQPTTPTTFILYLHPSTVQKGHTSIMGELCNLLSQGSTVSNTPQHLQHQTTTKSSKSTPKPVNNRSAMPTRKPR